MSEDKLNNAKRVRDHRKRRRDAGLIEMKFWVCSEDRGKVQNTLFPFTSKADAKVKSFRFVKFKLKEEMDKII